MSPKQDEHGTSPEVPAIETEKLCKTYNGDIRAVESLDLRVPRGITYALLGPNGAGKTTTIGVLTTLVEPTSGAARINGHDVVARAADVRRDIGVTFQEMVLDDALTGRQVLDYHGRLYGLSASERHERAHELLALTELADAADRKCKGYSGGMKRRLELARALMTLPRILFLDEPTLGLDPQGRARIWDYVRDLKRRTDLTVLLTTHYLDEAQELADRVGIMDHGHLVAEGSPSELIEELGADTIRVLGRGDGDDVETRLAGEPFVQSFSRVEGGFLLGVESSSRHLAEVVSTTTQAGFVIEDVSVAKPDLGAVFFKYTGRQLRDGVDS
ncbi:MAG: ATP-binding cassette domain-containing protein [Gemmatimonadota bacterium]|jgi:ABC-2 type transport system ATP-binding protein